MIDFTLDAEYEALRKTVAAFARDKVARVIGDFYRREAFPYEDRGRRWGGWGCSASPSRGVGRGAAGTSRCASRSRRSPGSTPRWG